MPVVWAVLGREVIGLEWKVDGGLDCYRSGGGALVVLGVRGGGGDVRAVVERESCEIVWGLRLTANSGALSPDELFLVSDPMNRGSYDFPLMSGVEPAGTQEVELL